MKFKEKLLQGTLIKRYKRFFADIKYQKKTITAHCPNSGSMMGLLHTGNTVYFSVSSNPKRKLKYTLEIVEIDKKLVGINTHLTNKIVLEALNQKKIRNLDKFYNIKTSGKHVVIVGRSNIVGKPMFALLSQKFEIGNATVTICHTGTKKLSEFTQRADIVVAATGSGAAVWSLGAWSDTTGFPSAVSFYEQRLVFAGSTDNPQTIWASESGAYEDFDVGDGSAADAFIYTIAANRVNVIRWLAPARDLIVGTAGGEFRVGRPTGEPLKPDNVTITQQTTYGGHTTQPIQVGSSVLFVQRQKRKVREFAYRFEDDAYVAPDMTLLAEHVTGDGIDDLDFAQEPESIYWAVREDGVLLGMTYQREEDVVAWHRHLFGGTDQNCTITVSDYANIQTGTTLKFTKSDGTTVTFTSTTGTAGTDEFKNETNNNTTADNIFTAINTHADFTVANPAAAIVTVFETTPAGTGLLTVESSDTVRLTTTDEKASKVKSVGCCNGTQSCDVTSLVVILTYWKYLPIMYSRKLIVILLSFESRGSLIASQLPPLDRSPVGESIPHRCQKPTH